jgi:hypothetical protein
MTFSDELKEKYGYNEPIYVNDIAFKNYSRAWIFKELQKLINSGEIIRFDVGIYYFPLKMFFGDSLLDPAKVVRKRFLDNGDDVYGYLAGVTLMNIVGINTQVPNLVELVSNNESTRVRDIRIGSQKVRARRARTPITKENVNTLQLLDLMHSIIPSNLDETEQFLLKKFARSLGTNKDKLLQYAGYFPSKAIRNLYESGVYYELT